jgi:hypothetical protein
MKIRNGFVANSSSSCFIIGFEKKPTLEEVSRIFKKLVSVARREKLEVCKYIPAETNLDEMAKIFYNEIFDLPQYDSDPKKQSDWAKNVLNLIDIVKQKQPFQFYVKLSILSKETQALADFLRGFENRDLYYLFLRYIGVT